ncbi:DUF3014 domain-containing protein [Methylobacter tundripaludum]|uniref:DUF3014 family protein n=1 Tax=Methylobacter tundripaludum (strain ATCC BAA-1195 / DSM 17260 / SV96) TaxID=697282 RepID=G3IVS1_METTV|nr:DUF3014 domain-containing protein [Methylobacter tundripaludum]EGW22928.1 hypothetical protein Mettu_1762 [Methylobacter tundripaludum SV96]
MNRYDQVKDKKIGGGVILVAIILIALTGGGWFYFEHLQSNAVTGPETRILALPPGSKETGTVDPLSLSEAIDGVTTTEAVPGAATDTLVELQQDASFILPDLDHSDALLREEMTGISPMLSGWLNTDQLVRKYVVIANDFSQGLRLEKNLRFLELDQPFAVDQDNENLFIATKSYQRYDRLAAAINALDVQATLAVYKKFRPLLVQVFREFSYPDEYSLEDIFTKAAAVILAAPARDGQIALERQSARYKFADQQLEALNPVHKQMLRMGPDNTRIIQNKLRLFVAGLANLKE